MVEINLYSKFNFSKEKVSIPSGKLIGKEHGTGPQQNQASHQQNGWGNHTAKGVEQPSNHKDNIYIYIYISNNKVCELFTNWN